ncbi:MAG TPA: SAM-dependent methyltransferase, partial [Actinomycetota bacterium]|nr:SAM-dependent methyltransferase [Actinomycetota bacterium]
LIRTQVRDHLLGHFQPGLPFSVQHRVLPMLAYRPYEIQVALQDEVQEQVGLPVSVRDPQQVLSVVVSDAGGALEAHLGVSRTDHNLSAWPGGMRRFAREPDQVSRSEFKLLEALEAFGVTLDDAHHALDLGASPGGWTRILTGRGLRVVAVDPADLHPSVESHPLVTHLRATAGDAFSRRDLPVFDLVANDLRMEARHSAKLTVRAAGLLKPGAGTAIMTLKLPAKRPLRVLDDAMSILSARYRIRGARHLFHNRHEVTAHLSLT